MNNDWIPVSERLPNKDGYYICSLTDLKYHNSFVKLMIFNADNKIFESFYDVGGYYDILAWMELPKCYKVPNRDINVIFEVSDDITDERFLHALQFRLKEHANKIKIKSINNKELTHTGVY